jgi:hypothetical protein
MNNSFHEIELKIAQEGADTKEVVRALLAIIHLESCQECSSRLRSEEFLENFQHLLKELKLCHELTSQNVA